MEFTTFAVLDHSPNPMHTRAWPQNLETTVMEQGQKKSLDQVICLDKDYSVSCTNLALKKES